MYALHPHFSLEGVVATFGPCLMEEKRAGPSLASKKQSHQILILGIGGGKSQHPIRWKEPVICWGGTYGLSGALGKGNVLSARRRES